MAGDVVDTLKKIGRLRKRVQKARSERSPLQVHDALEYDILRQSLELLGDVINGDRLLSKLYDDSRFGRQD